MGKKQTWFAVLLVLSVAILAACQPAATPAPESGEGAVGEGEEGDRLHFCVVHNNADHPSITAIVNGMEAEAAAYGSIDLTFYDPAYDPQKQLDMIEEPTQNIKLYYPHPYFWAAFEIWGEYR